MTEACHLSQLTLGRLFDSHLAEISGNEAPLVWPGLTVADAIAQMGEAEGAALVLGDENGRPAKLVRRADIMAALRLGGAAALSWPLARLAAPAADPLDDGTPVYLALGRMRRKGASHVVVGNKSRRGFCRVIGATDLLGLMSSPAFALHDALARAGAAADLAPVRHDLIEVAASLSEDGLGASSVAGVISDIVRGMTARLAALAEQAMAADGWGGPPAPYALLVLGSAGRGESLLAFDQDNALVHDGGPGDRAWFLELGRRVADGLDSAGIPYCQGGVMAKNNPWCRTLGEWGAEIQNWVFDPSPARILNVDIFFDFVPVHGDRALGERLRDQAVETARQSAFFLRFLALSTAHLDVPMSMFGGFATKNGRFNAKKTGLLPIVGVGRARALAAGIKATNTAERYRALAGLGEIGAEDLDGILDAHDAVQDAILRQQRLDLKAGIPPSALVDPERIGRQARTRLRGSMARIRAMTAVLGGL